MRFDFVMLIRDLAILMDQFGDKLEGTKEKRASSCIDGLFVVSTDGHNR